MNCIIVDDDDITRMEVERLVSKTPFLKLIKSCSGAIEAYNIISERPIDLVFLDVMMPEMSGLDLMKSFYKEQPQVILMTLNKDFALEAFDYDVTDFLMKPISEDRFFRAVAKAKRVYDNEHKNGEPKSYIFAKVDTLLVKINTKDILYIEATGNYISVYTDKERFVIYSTMKTIMEKLPEKDFMRVHLSFIVRIDKISQVDGNTIIINRKLIPVSRTYKEHLNEKLNLI
jgi:two-component system, LytTR family, response regulator